MASYTLIFIAMIIRNKSVFQNDGYHNETCEVQAFLAQLFGRYGNVNVKMLLSSQFLIVKI